MEEAGGQMQASSTPRPFSLHPGSERRINVPSLYEWLGYANPVFAIDGLALDKSRKVGYTNAVPIKNAW